MIVEDEIFVALDLERILLDAGYDVVAIESDHQGALAAAPGCRFAFVDINLRDGPTGPRIARDITAAHGVKVVFVTANPSQIGRPVTALGYIRKPFNDEAIRAAASHACDPSCRAIDATAFVPFDAGRLS